MLGKQELKIELILNPPNHPEARLVLIIILSNACLEIKLILSSSPISVLLEMNEDLHKASLRLSAIILNYIYTTVSIFRKHMDCRFHQQKSAFSHKLYNIFYKHFYDYC